MTPTTSMKALHHSKMYDSIDYPTKAYENVEYGLLLPDAAVTVERRKKQGRNWSKCLCITLLVIVGIFFLTSAIFGLCGYFWMKHHIKRFTTEESMQFPIHEIPSDELEVLKDRAKLFFDSVKAGLPTEDFTIGEDEMNGFVAHSDFLRGNAVVHLDENKFSADMSLPAKGLPGGKGRFFVGTGSITLADNQEGTLITTELETVGYEIEGLDYPKLLLGTFLAYIAEDGSKTVNIQSGQFYNWVAPADFIAKKENLLNHLCDDEDDDNDKDCEEFQAFLDGLDSVSITDKKITFRGHSGEGRRLSGLESNVAKTKSLGFGSYARRSLMKMLL